MTVSFHIRDYPSREAQWVAALKWRRAAALTKLTQLSQDLPGGYR